MGEKKKFEAFDDYEGNHESLGQFDTKPEANKAVKQRREDTDGECRCYVVPVEAK
jgi:hypothetical protein